MKNSSSQSFTDIETITIEELMKYDGYEDYKKDLDWWKRKLINLKRLKVERNVPYDEYIKVFNKILKEKPITNNYMYNANDFSDDD